MSSHISNDFTYTFGIYDTLIFFSCATFFKSMEIHTPESTLRGVRVLGVAAFCSQKGSFPQSLDQKTIGLPTTQKKKEHSLAF